MTATPHPDWHQDQFQDRGGLAGYRYRQAGPVSLYLGDAREVLAAMPDASVDIVAFKGNVQCSNGNQREHAGREWRAMRVVVGSAIADHVAVYSATW